MRGYCEWVFIDTTKTRVPTPKFAVYERGTAIRPPKRMSYPMFVKSTTEDASFGLSKKSIVHTPELLVERVHVLRDVP